MMIFDAKTYRSYLHTAIEENSSIYGYKAKLADAAGCQRPYFSQVLALRAHLTPEHALKLCAFWRFGDRETQYFLNLVHFERAGTRELKEFHQKTLHSLKEERQVLAKRFGVKDIPLHQQTLYYSHWLYSAIHILVTIPSFQTIPAIAERLGVSPLVISRALEKLTEIRLVTSKHGRWTTTDKVLHISKNSSLNARNHQNWRERAVADTLSENPHSVHYTAVYSLSRSDAEKLKSMVLALIDDSRKIVEPSPEEDVVCMNFDFFRV